MHLPFVRALGGRETPHEREGEGDHARGRGESPRKGVCAYIHACRRDCARGRERPHKREGETTQEGGRDHKRERPQGP